MQLRSAALVSLLCTAFLPGCDKVEQCNTLIDTVESRTAEMTAATNALAAARSKPEVIADYEKAFQTTIDAVAALKLSDEKLADFGKRYASVLGEAKALGPKRAAASTREEVDAVKAEEAKVLESEEALVKEINTYCSAG